MKIGRTIYLDGVKSTYCGLTPRGYVKVLTAGKVLTVSASRVTWSKQRSDIGGKHRKKEVAGG